MPTRNRAKLLERAIGSVLAQGRSDWELIVLDDGSTDHTPEVLARLASSDSRIRTVPHSSAKGPARARNRGIGLGRGEFVAFLDDDDEWLPHKLERAVEALEREPAAGLAYSPFFFVDAHETEHVYGVVDVSQDEPLRRLLAGNFLGTSAVVARRELLLDVGGFNEAMPSLEDWDLWLRVAARVRFAYVPEPLVRIWFSQASVTSWQGARRRACDLIAERMESLCAGDRRALADGYHALAYELLTHGLAAPGRSYMRRSVALRPWPPQRLCMAAAAHAPLPAYRLVTDLHRARSERAARRGLGRPPVADTRR